MRVQNLRDNARSRKNNWLHMRGWSDIKGRFNWRWEVNIRKTMWYFWRLTATIGGEDTRSVSLSIGFPYFSLFITFPNILPKKWEVGWYSRDGVKNPLWFEDSHGRSYGTYFVKDDWFLVFEWNRSNAGGGRDKKVWGWSKSFFVNETILGRRRMTEGANAREFKALPVPFPERVYHISGKISVDVWKYDRWPWWPFTLKRSRLHFDVDEKEGIRAPGKGENSWDCGDNNLHGGCHSNILTLEEAVRSVQQSVNRDRKRYGSGEFMYVNKQEIQKNESITSNLSNAISGGVQSRPEKA